MPPSPFSPGDCDKNASNLRERGEQALARPTSLVEAPGGMLLVGAKGGASRQHDEGAGDLAHARAEA